MASILKVDKLDPQSGTALEIGTSGDTVSIPSGATLDISASTLTPPATMPASSGVNLTALNATELTSGTVPAARLSGVGKILQVLNATKLDTFSSSAMAGGAFVDVTDLSVAITPASASNKILVQVQYNGARFDGGSDYGTTFGLAIYKSATGITDGLLSIGAAASSRSRTTSMFNNTASDGRNIYTIPLIIYDTTGTTNEITYKVQLTQGFNLGSGTGIIYCNRTAADGDNYSGMRASSTITVTEIAA
jgi:hypothetical protein